MKRFRCLLLFLPLFHAVSQPLANEPRSTSASGMRLVRLVYNNTDGEAGVTWFNCEPSGCPAYSFWELENGKRYSLNYLSYDERGNLVKKFREYSDSKNTVQIFRYDEGNRLVSEEFILRDTSRGITTFEYDGQGRLAKALCNAYLGWIRGTITYAYDAGGRRTGGELRRGEKKLATITYSYSDTLLVDEVWKFEVGWQQTFHYEYQDCAECRTLQWTQSNAFLASNTRRLIGENYSYNDRPVSPSKFRYDAQGRLVEKIFERSDGFSTVTVYFYNTAGLLARAFRHYSNGKNALFRFEHNGQRKMTVKDFRLNDGSAGKETYEYNGNGVLVRAQFEQSDFWLTGALTFTPDDRGRPAHASYTGSKGESADLKFDYDQNGCLVSLQWEFKDGTRQRYWFEY